MEANKKQKAKKENIWTADANSDVSDSQLNDSNDSDETQIVYKQFSSHSKSVRLVYIYIQAQILLKLLEVIVQKLARVFF